MHCSPHWHSWNETSHGPKLHGEATLDESFCRQLESLSCKLEEPAPEFIFPRNGSAFNIIFMLAVAKTTQVLKHMCIHNSLKVFVLLTKGKECRRLKEKSYLVQWMLL